MTLKEVQEKLQGKFETTDIIIQTNYIVKLGKEGTITLYYRNNEFQKIAIDGNSKDKIAKTLGIETQK